MAKFFIDRPIFAIALSLVIVFAGVIAGFSLPIAQYPNITKPQIEVETNYVGANASTVEESIAQAIEQKVNGVENMRDMRSTSTNTGRYVLDVNFNLEKNGDIASVEVQNLHAYRGYPVRYYHGQDVFPDDHVFCTDVPE